MTLDNVIMDIASIGFGVQSTGILFGQEQGLFPRTDKNYFADLGRESKEVYDYIGYALPILQSKGIDCTIIKTADIYNHIMSWDVADRISMIPVWFIGENGKPQPLNRQCTSDFKIEEIASAIREDYAIKRFKKWSIRIWQGISVDEESRVKKTKLFPTSGLTYRINHYPYISKYASITDPKYTWVNYTREDIIEKIFKKMGLKIPPKSSCFFCPFHTIFYWLHIYMNFPEEYELACILDESIRNYNSQSGSLKSGPFYLYRCCIPLRGLDFDAEIRKLATNSIPLYAGGCETGFCYT